MVCFSTTVLQYISEDTTTRLQEIRKGTLHVLRAIPLWCCAQQGLGSATAPPMQTLLGRNAHLIHFSFLPVTKDTHAFFLAPVSNFITAGSQREMPPAFLGGVP